MNKKNDRIVYRTGDGHWATKKVDSAKAASLHATQKEAEDAARQMLRNQGGGELITKGLDGKIRSEDTITVAPAYHVFNNQQGEWSVKKSGSEKAIKVFDTREKAVAFAREKSRQEKNELVIHSKDGRIQSKVSYGSDPYPPRDKEGFNINTKVLDLTIDELKNLISTIVHETMEDFLEDLKALSSKVFIKSIKEAREDYKAGDVKNFNEVF